MTFFFDNNWSTKAVAAFKALDQEVMHLQERFAPDTPDEAWIPWVGEQGYRLVSCDVRIKRNPQQRVVLEKAGIVSFFAVGGVVNLPNWDNFTWLVRAWPPITAQARKSRTPGSFRVTMHYKIEPWGK